MSGGYFNYDQFKMLQIAEDIQNVIDNNNVENEYGYVNNFSDETISKFKEAVKMLQLAYVMSIRIDYLLSGDDGEDNFHTRWNKDINELNNELKGE